MAYVLCSQVPKRTFQRGLRTPFAACLVLSVACTTFAVRVRSASTQSEAATQLRKAGLQVFYEYELDEKGRQIDGDRQGFLPNVPWRLRKYILPNVTKVSAPWCAFGSFHIAYRSDADDNSIAPLRYLPALQYIELDFSNVSDAGIDSIKGLKRVVKLGLKETRITDAGLASLSGLNQLAELDITSTEVTDAGLRELSRFPELKILRVGGERITDRGIAELACLRSLESLYIETPPIGKQLPDLTFPTLITDPAVDSLRRKLPNCKINFRVEFF